MEHKKLTDIELWDYISGRADRDTVLRVRSWLRSMDFDSKRYRQLKKVHTLTATVRTVEYDSETNMKKLMRFIASTRS